MAQDLFDEQAAETVTHGLLCARTHRAIGRYLERMLGYYSVSTDGKDNYALACMDCPRCGGIHSLVFRGTDGWRCGSPCNYALPRESFPPDPQEIRKVIEFLRMEKRSKAFLSSLAYFGIQLPKEIRS